MALEVTRWLNQTPKACCIRTRYTRRNATVRTVPKSRKSRIPPELIAKLEELQRRAEEDSRKTAELNERAEKFQRRLREIYAGR